MPQHRILTLTLTPDYFFRGPDGTGDPGGPRSGLHAPLAPFQASLLLPCCLVAPPLLPPPAPLLVVVSLPSSRGLNQGRTRTSEDAPEWAVGEGVGRISVLD